MRHHLDVLRGYRFCIRQTDLSHVIIHKNMYQPNTNLNACLCCILDFLLCVFTMNIVHSLPSTVTSVGFSFLTSQDIRRISVKQIVNSVLLDDLNRPSIGGLYDPALGPSDRSDMWVHEIFFEH